MQIEFRCFGVGGIFWLSAISSILRNAGVDRGDFGCGGPEFVADKQRGVDGGVDHPATGISLEPEAALGEVIRAAEIGKRLRAPLQSARKGMREAATPFDRRRVRGEAA